METAVERADPIEEGFTDDDEPAINPTVCITVPITATEGAASEWEQRPLDTLEECCHKFFETGCGCRESSHQKFPRAYLERCRNEMAELTRDELDVTIMSQVMASTFSGEMTAGIKQQPRERVLKYSNYTHR